MVETNAYTNVNHNFYNTTVQEISWREGYYDTKDRSLWEYCVIIKFPMKTELNLGMDKYFDVRVNSYIMNFNW